MRIESNEQKNRHIWLILILLLFSATTLTYSLILPLGEAADEFEHFALIRFIAEEQRLPLTLKEQQTISAKGDASPIYHTLVAALTQHVDISPLPELPDPRHKIERAIPYDHLPFKGLYHTEDEYFPFRGIVLAWHLARLISIPLAVLTLIAVYRTNSIIFPQRPFFALATTTFVAFIPRFVINSAIISDDNLVIPMMAFAIYVLIKIIHGDTQQQTLIFLGVFMGLAAIAKYHSLSLIPLVMIVLALLGWQQCWTRQLWLRRGGIVMLAFLLTAGWWFTFLIIQFNQIEQLGLLRGLIAPLGDPVIAGSVERVLDFQSGSNLGYEAELGGWGWVALLFKTFWFRYGRGHTIDSLFINGSLAIFALLALAGLGLMLWQQRRQVASNARNIKTWRLDIVTLALLFLIYFGVVVTRYLTLPTRETAQGRHLYPTLIAIAFFIVLGLSHLFRQRMSIATADKTPAPPGVTESPPSISPKGGEVSSSSPLWGELEGGKQFTFRITDKILALTIGLLFFGFSAITLTQFIMPVYYPYLPIQRLEPVDAPIQHRLDQTFAAGVNFKGYSLSTATSNVLSVTLYWQATGTPDRDYLINLCLHDTDDQPVACWQGHPANGRHPTRAWEAGYLIRDDIYMPLPHCLPAGNYNLNLSMLPLRLDTASTEVDETAQAVDVLALGQVPLLEIQITPASNIEGWTAGNRFTQEQLDIDQIRQTLTVIQNGSGNSADLLFRPIVSDYLPLPWDAVFEPVNYACANGTIVETYNFIVDASVIPTTYVLETGQKTNGNLVVDVTTRHRFYKAPLTLSEPNIKTFGDEIELLGYNIDLSPRLPGDTVDIDLYWRALKTMRHRYVGSVHLLDNTVTMWSQIDHVLGDDFEYPNVLWAPGEVVQQVYSLPIDQQTPAGLYTIEFGVYDNTFGDFNFLPVSNPGVTDPAKQLNLGQIRILDPARIRPPDEPTLVLLTDQIRLLGFDLDSRRLERNSALDFALHWQAIEQPDIDYTVFTQLIGPDGQVWGQQDNQPQGGRYPTTQWAVGERVVDRYRIVLNKNAPAGEYRLLVGMYNLQTGQRLPVSAEDGTPIINSAILLTTLTVE